MKSSHDSESIYSPIILRRRDPIVYQQQISHEEVVEQSEVVEEENQVNDELACQEAVVVETGGDTKDAQQQVTKDLQKIEGEIEITFFFQIITFISCRQTDSPSSMGIWSR